MKIILKGADFSANNIGTTTVPLFTTPESEAVFSAIPITFAAMNDTKKLALNSAINSLVSNGIYDRATDLYISLPVMDASERWVNLANPTETLAYPSSGYATYDTNGITPILGFNTGKALAINNRHVMFHNTESADASKSQVSVAGTTYSQWVGRRVATGNAGYLYDSSNRAQASGDAITNTGCMVAGNDGTALIMVEGNNVVVNNTSLTISGDTPVIMFATSDGGTSGLADHAHSCVGWGESLTESQMISYKNTINSLIESLSA